MKALILAAGLGTRLQPLTTYTPKSLVHVHNKPLLAYALEKMAACSVSEVVINVHYLAEQIITFVENLPDLGIKIIISDEREQLLDTGGALKKTAAFFENETCFLVYNADVLTNVDLRQLITTHLSQQNDASLLVRPTQSARRLLFDAQSLDLHAWQNTVTKEEIRIHTENSLERSYGFCGVQCLSPSIFSFFPKKTIFSLIDLYLAAAQKLSIRAYPLPAANWWFDTGSIEKLRAAENYLRKE
ncbi:MAG: nucleotidyltransferase family protein [Chitinophagales bacterium]|nr:nucleotidyltransferase family protein [Bacteroidota bacterium]MCB9042477.1 nucleotidyltransferase family protein [Chitinophagales bacterium]